jgi:hypothetical protein
VQIDEARRLVLRCSPKSQYLGRQVQYLIGQDWPATGLAAAIAMLTDFVTTTIATATNITTNFTTAIMTMMTVHGSNSRSKASIIN